MTKSVLAALAGATLASAWWACGTGVVSADTPMAVPVGFTCVFGTIGAIIFLVFETASNWDQ